MEAERKKTKKKMTVQGIVSTTESNDDDDDDDDDEVDANCVAMYRCLSLGKRAPKHAHHTTHTHSIYVVTKVICGSLKDLNSFNRSCWGWCNCGEIESS